jgi:glycosyltransferase involved in cell wall biosynthesis
MHVLVTTDTISGVWGYTRELVSGLVSRGLQVTLVSFGEIPLPQQTRWMDALHGLTYHPTAFRLEWMQEGEADFSDASDFILGVVHDTQPDVLHLNQFCYGALPVKTPRVVVAHGDLVTWWLSVHGCEPRPTRWLERYRDRVTAGLEGATRLVSASRWMLDLVRLAYGLEFEGQVIYNGRNPIFFNPYATKEDSVLTVGRMLDAGRQVHLLTHHRHPVPVCIAGGEPGIATQALPIRADVQVATESVRVALKGPQTDAQLRLLYSRATIYAATPRYDPFGLTTLEAALSRCALVANDTPAFREIWGADALYFETNNAESLAAAIRRFAEDRDLCRTYANRSYQRARDRYNHKRMLDEYLALYRGLAARSRVAA